MTITNPKLSHFPETLGVGQIVISFADCRFVRSDDSCDLGKEEDCDEFQSDVQAAAGGLSQTPL